MTEFFIIAFFIVLLVVYLYFGYYQDYKRNPKEFTKNIIGMPLGMLAGFFGLNSIDEKLKKWANSSDLKKKKESEK